MNEGTLSAMGSAVDNGIAPGSRLPLVPGSPVEVRTRFLPGRWARGFEIAQTSPTGGYRIRRRSDQSLLPVELPAADVRPDPNPGGGDTLWV